MYDNSSSTPDYGASASGQTVSDTAYGGMALTAVGGLTTAYGQIMSARYNRHVADINARLARQQAQQALQAGDFAANRVAEKERLVDSAVRASAAGGNVVAGAGSNRAVTFSNQAASDMDRLMIEINARRQAYGFQVRAASDTAQGRMATQAGNLGAAGTLLNTGAQEWLESDPNYTGFRGRGIQFG